MEHSPSCRVGRTLHDNLLGILSFAKLISQYVTIDLVLYESHNIVYRVAPLLVVPWAVLSGQIWLLTLLSLAARSLTSLCISFVY